MSTRRDEAAGIVPAVLKTLRGLGISIGVALVFYAVSYWKLRGPREHLKYILTCTMYGTVVYLCIWLVYAVQRAILRRRPGTDPTRISLPSHFLLSMGGSSIGLFLAIHADAWLNHEEFTYSQYWESLVISIFIALMFQFYFAWKRSTEENLQLKAAKAEAELQTLRNQMQPHFLFNSLNSLAALIDSDPGTAGEATQKLADLYRLILDCSRATLSPLEREVQIARLYLEIERIRFGSRLSFLLPTLSPAERDLLVPSLVIQTLVENAVKHGIAGALEGGYVHLVVRREPRGLRVEVLNTGAPPGTPRAGATGLKNTEERLALLFGSEHGFRLARTEAGLTCASFLIPEKA